MYADSVTPSMERAIREAESAKTNKYNETSGIVPKTIVKDVRDILEISSKAGDEEKPSGKLSAREREQLIVKLTAEMKAAAKILEFEHAAYLRDRIEKLRQGKVQRLRS